MNASTLVRQAGGAALATDERNCITAWNAAAEELLGYSWERALGSSFQDLLKARDVFGNELCTDGCAYRELARRGEPIRGFELELRHADGAWLRVGVAVVVVLGEREGRSRLGYHLQAIRRRRAADELLEKMLQADPAAQPGADSAGNGMPLTRRELEVLRLLCAGGSTDGIAGELGVAANTVRNHIRNLLKKLGVHSRVEAVSWATRKRLF